MASIPLLDGKTDQIRSAARDKRLWGLILISPWLIGLAVFKLGPILATLVFSFTNFHLLNPDQIQWVGIKNYVDLLHDPNLTAAFLGTIRLALIMIPLQVLAAVVLASLLASRRLWMRNIMRVLFFIPSIIASFPAKLMWQGFVNPKTGWLYPFFLAPLGLAKYLQLSSRGSDPTLMIITTFWSIGPGFLIILGAMQGIPTEIHDAAKVDGAGRWRELLSITIPMVSPAIFFTLILNLTALFGGAILLDRGTSFNSSTSSVDSYLYYILFGTFRLGAASSLAWIFFLFMLALVLLLFLAAHFWVYFPGRED